MFQFFLSDYYYYYYYYYFSSQYSIHVATILVHSVTLHMRREVAKEEHNKPSQRKKGAGAVSPYRRIARESFVSATGYNTGNLVSREWYLWYFVMFQSFTFHGVGYCEQYIPIPYNVA